METTRGIEKSHSCLGWANGATNAPEAPSTWIGIEIPVFTSYCFKLTSISWKSKIVTRKLPHQATLPSPSHFRNGQCK